MNKSFIHLSPSFLANFSFALNNPCPIPNVRATYMSSLLSHLKRGSSAGPDGLPLVYLKLCNRKIAPVISEMFNSSLSQCKISDNWRNVRIKPLPKNSSVNSAPIKYRHIAIASTRCKLFQKITLSILSSTLDAASKPLQFAFKKHRST